MRLLVMRAHPDLGHKERKRILVTNFHLGFRDQDLAALLAIATITSSAEAELRDKEGKSAMKNARINNSYTNYIYQLLGKTVRMLSSGKQSCH